MNGPVGELSLPIPIVKRRSPDPDLLAQAQALGFSPVAARVVAGRFCPGGDLRAFLASGVNQLDSPSLLADGEYAAQRLAGAILSREVIGIASDYDMDGLGAHAAFRVALIEKFGHPAQRLRSYIGHRLAEGYGLTPTLTSRILNDEPRVSVLVTADCGSGDDARIARLSAAGVDVIVTDHHEVPAGRPPPSAYACLNPQRSDCPFPDKAIAGGMVLWLLLRLVREVLIEAGYGPAGSTDLGDLLDFVACSTVADCVSLSSRNNRAVVRAGLARMNERQRPCWKAFDPLNDDADFHAHTIAYSIAPRINARTRLSDPFAALHFLLANDVRSAARWFSVLDEENRSRREIERVMLQSVMADAARQVAAGRGSIVLALPGGHPGVQGICSSRLVETFGRPAFLFSPHAAESGMLTGSARAVEGIHVQRLLLSVDRCAPGLIQAFGGHKAAAGAKIRVGDFARFDGLFEAATQATLNGAMLGPQRSSDGSLEPDELSLELVKELSAIEPTGRGFEPAQFDGIFEVLDVRSMGDDTHLRLVLKCGVRRISAVWFRARAHPADPLPVRARQRAHFVYGLSENVFNGVRRLQVRIEAMVSAPTRATECPVSRGSIRRARAWTTRPTARARTRLA